MTGGKKASIPVHGWHGERAPIPAPPCEPKGGSKKNTKRWCKGVVGRDHEPQLKTISEIHGRLNTPQGRAQEAEYAKNGWGFASKWKVEVCQRCGRHLRYIEGTA